MFPRSLSALHGEIEHLRAGNGQVIRIAAYPSVAKSILPSLIQKFQTHNPNITLELQISGYDIREWVSSGIVDLAFVDEGLGEKQDWLPLFRDPYFVAVSADSPLSTRKSVTVQDLADQAFILSQINELKPLSRLGKLREQLHINASDDTAVLSLVEQGLGVTILPESSLKGHSDKIRVLSLDPPLRRTIGIVRSKTVNRSADEFVDFSSRELRRAD
jgi:DNA-binding transcriptional LysR family regulator